MVEFGAEGSDAERTLRQWQAYRYGIALRFVERAAEAYAAERRRAGLLSFNDLLMEAAKLLRGSPSARQDLAQRYRYLLVDEFQDTDPLQAEIVFLLTAADPEVSKWLVAEPRPGALFVVGDPKQSIYRFRCADIGMYNQVKRRFDDFGEVVGLTTNFRSRPPIETFVNGVFEKLLPAEVTESQAAFATLNADRDDAEPQGVFWYEVVSSGNTVDDIAAKDARLVAGWIKQRVDSGEREPGDFLVLTYRKQWLSVYAAELERHEVALEVTGAGIDLADELEELLHVLRAVADPDNQVLTLAALVGLFFGIDHEQLAAHRLEHRLADKLGNGMFDFTASQFATADASSTAVERALSQLRGWWCMTRRLPADVVVGAIVSDLGLLPYLAAGASGGSSAGALAYTLSAVRQAGMSGDSSLRAALDALEEALAVEDAEAPLQPGREDVVRVMNLHKAKGLEANVVILAHPTGHKVYEPAEHVERPEEGDAHGGLLIEEKTAGHQRSRIAAPLSWDEMAAREALFMADEKVRLLYVAATRAREELVVSYCAKTEKKSPWRPFYEHRERLCTHIELHDVDPPEPESLDLSAESITTRVDELRASRRARATPSYEITSVTKMVKHDASVFAVDGGGRGRAWGNAVHEALEAANRSGGAVDIRAICRGALLDNELPVLADGEPEDLEDLLALVEGVRGSETWQRAQEADSLLVEAPFAMAEAGATRIVEGVIDLVFEEDDGWVIVDYKTDVVDDPDNLAARRKQYRAQVDAYARYFEAITGATVKERQILWVGGELEAEVW
jgi:ATP-dependent helicase/nuclease subunit A